MLHQVNIILLFLSIILAAGNDVIDLKTEISTATNRHHHSNIRGIAGGDASSNALDDLDILLEEEDPTQQVERQAQQGRYCRNFKDCPSGYGCRKNACYRQSGGGRCVTPRDCPPTFDCVYGTCRQVPTEEVTSCRFSSGCPLGSLCNSKNLCERSDGFGLCWFCRENGDCAPGLRCNKAKAACVFNGSTTCRPCQSIQTCGEYQRCKDNRCIWEDWVAVPFGQP